MTNSNGLTTAIIVDDERSAIDYLLNILEIHKDISVLECFTSPELAIQRIRILKPDILFLDVQMPIKTGFDIVKDVRSDDYQPNIIFTTGFEKFAIRAIKYAAFDYLLKPINEFELSETLEKIKQNGSDSSAQRMELLFKKLSQSKKLKFNTSTGFIVLNTDEIIYCEASRNYCEIYMEDGRREVVTMNMNQVGKLLPDDHYYRISRFNIININYLDRVERKDHKCFLKSNGDYFSLKISSSGLKELENFLI